MRIDCIVTLFGNIVCIIAITWTLQIVLCFANLLMMWTVLSIVSVHFYDELLIPTRYCYSYYFYQYDFKSTSIMLFAAFSILINM